MVSYLAFVHWLVYPPLVTSLVSFASAGLLGLLRHTLVTSSALDAGLLRLGGRETSWRRLRRRMRRRSPSRLTSALREPPFISRPRREVIAA